MTWWSPLEVLAFARKAGFDDHDAKRAATIALVATKGADHWTFKDPTAPKISSSGLWAIPDVLASAIGAGDQMNPAESAATARAIFRDTHNNWTWHPVYAADAGAMVRRTLDALDLDGLWLATPSRLFATVAQLRDHAYTSKRIESILSRYPVGTL